MSEEYKTPDERLVDFYSRKLRRHPITRWSINILSYLTIFPATLLFTKEGREALRGKIFYEKLFNREKRIGFLEDSILDMQQLYVPDNGSLRLVAKEGVAIIGYDFHRKKEFGKKSEHLRKGSLYAFPLEEVMDNSPHIYTPTPLFQLFDLRCMVHLCKPSLEQLMEWGLLQKTTYSDAFDRAGEKDYRTALQINEIAEREVYQITPKGNALVFLCRDGGDKTKQKDKAGSLARVPDYGLAH